MLMRGISFTTMLSARLVVNANQAKKSLKVIIKKVQKKIKINSKITIGPIECGRTQERLPSQTLKDLSYSQIPRSI